MALPSVEYTPRDLGGSVLYQIVRNHFETFRAEAARLRDGEGRPRFVEEEFESLVDRVFPDVPVRQGVLSLPPRIRYLRAWRHDLCKAVVGVLRRAVNRHLRERARACGLADPRGGAVAVVQRFPPPFIAVKNSAEAARFFGDVKHIHGVGVPLRNALLARRASDDFDYFDRLYGFTGSL